jgi:HK97 family phage portal protein
MRILDKARGLLRRAARSDRSAVLDATVRYSETLGLTRERANAGELVKRAFGCIFTAANRNAAGVASTPWHVYREARGEADKGWRAKSVARSRLEYMSAKSSPVVRKMVDNSDDLEEITDRNHPLVRLLNEANHDTNGFALLETCELDQAYTGDAFWLKVRGPNNWPIEVYRLHPRDVTVVPDGEQMLVGAYVYGRGRENEVEFEASDVVHFRRPNPTGNPYHGYAELEAVLSEADVTGELAVFWLSVLRNMAQPGMIIAGQFNDQHKKQIEAALARRSGTNQAGRSLILGGLGKEDIFAMPWQTSLNELGGIESWKAMREVIAGAFDLPVGLLTLDSAALATADAAPEHWAMFGLRPRLRRLEDTLNAGLVSEFREAMGDDSLFLAFDDPSQEAIDSTSARVVSQFQAGVISRDEARADLMMDAVDNEPVYAQDLGGGADPFGGLFSADPEPLDLGTSDEGSIPVEPAKQALQAPQVQQLTSILDRIRDGEMSANLGAMVLAEAFPTWPEERIREMAEEAAAHGQSRVPLPDREVSDNGDAEMGVPPERRDYGESDGEGVPTGAGLGGGKSGTGSVDEGEDLFRPAGRGCCGHDYITKDDDDRTILEPRGMRQIISATEAQLERRLNRFFREILPRLESGVRSNGEFTFDIEADPDIQAMFAEAMDDPLSKVILEGYERAVRELGERAGAAADEGSIYAAQARMMEDRAAQVISSVGATLTDRIRRDLAEGVTAGETLNQLQSRIRGLADVTPYASERIARTEVSRAFNDARLEAWDDSGAVEMKEWLVAGEPCPICDGIAAKGAVGLREMFEDEAGRRYNGPPAHPNCRCSLGARFIDE